MKNYILFLLTFIFSLTTFASDTINTATIFTGGKVYKNYVVNPSCEFNTNGMTYTSSSGPTRTTNFSGQHVCSWAPAADAKTLTIATTAIGTDLGLSQCEATFDAASATGSAVTFKAQLLYDGVEKDVIADLAPSGGYTTYKLQAPCPGSTIFAFNIVLTSTSASPGTLVWRNAYFGKSNINMQTVNTADKDYGPITLTSTGTSPTKGVTSADHFWAHREGSSLKYRMEYAQSATTGSAKGTGDHLYAVPTATGCQIDSSKMTFYTSSPATSTPNIAGSGQVTSSSSSQPASAIAYDATHFRIVAGANGSANTNFVGGGNSWYDVTQSSISYSISGSIPCQGWLASQAVTSDQTNYGRTSYTPTFTGFGTVSGVNCTNKRDGEYDLIDCTFTVGTPTATEARVSLPSGLTSISGLPTLSKVGGGARNVANAENQLVFIEPSVSYLTFGVQSSGTSGLSKANGNVITSTGNVYSFNARVPISGWQENGKAATLNGSVNTSSKSSAWNIESARFGGASTTTACSSTPCTLYSNSGGFSSVSRASTGQYVANFVSGTFSSAPTCTFTVGNGANVLTVIETVGTPPTSTTFAFNPSTTSNTAADVYGSIICMGLH